MYEFLDRLVNIALPRIKDFRGYQRMDLINLEIILLELKNILFSLKLVLIEQIKLED